MQVLFDTPEDRGRFLREVGKRLDEDVEPKDHHRFIQHRKMIVPLLKDFRRSQQAKHQWRTIPTQMLFPMRKWHRGSEGRTFHRQLGRFLATRERQRSMITSTLHENAHLERLSVPELHNLIKGITAALPYYRSASDQAWIEMILEDLYEDLATGW